MKKVVIVLLILLLVGCGKSELAKSIISNVESAYDKASVNGMPTLNQVKANFKMDNASWLADQIIADDGLACDIKTDGGMLVVKCPNNTSEKSMPIYK